MASIECKKRLDQIWKKAEKIHGMSRIELKEKFRNDAIEIQRKAKQKREKDRLYREEREKDRLYREEIEKKSEILANELTGDMNEAIAIMRSFESEKEKKDKEDQGRLFLEKNKERQKNLGPRRPGETTDDYKKRVKIYLAMCRAKKN
jgi:hypothetical protein